MDTNLSKLWETVVDRGGWLDAVQSQKVSWELTTTTGISSGDFGKRLGVMQGEGGTADVKERRI